MKKVKKVNLFFLIVMSLLIFYSLFARRILKFFNLKMPLALSMVAAEIILLTCVIVYLIVTKSSPKKILRLNRLNFKSFLIIIFIGLSIRPVMGFLALISKIFFHSFVSDSMNIIDQFNLGTQIFIVCLVPAICEEFTMRGVILSGYKGINVFKAALMNGFMFGLFHMNPEQFFYAFAMGMIFCYIIYYTNSIFSTVIIHFIFNASSIIPNYFMSPNYANNTMKLLQNKSFMTITLISSFFMAVMFMVISIFLIYLLAEVNNKKFIFINGKMADDDSLEINGFEEQRVFTWHIAASIVLYFGFLCIYQYLTHISILNM